MPLSTFLRGGHPSTPPHADNLEQSTPFKHGPIGVPDEHLQAFNVFKENLTKAGLYTPATESSAASADDVTLAYVSRTIFYVQPLNCYDQTFLQSTEIRPSSRSSPVGKPSLMARKNGRRPIVRHV